jgi:hypothetical protein
MRCWEFTVSVMSWGVVHVDLDQRSELLGVPIF